MKKCTDVLQSDVDTFTKEQYQQMEQELADKINQLIKETEDKYCVSPFIEPLNPPRRVSVFIVNKATHNNPPFPKD
jgi:hypothetical protein